MASLTILATAAVTAEMARNLSDDQRLSRLRVIIAARKIWWWWCTIYPIKFHDNHGHWESWYWTTRAARDSIKTHRFNNNHCFSMVNDGVVYPAYHDERYGAAGDHTVCFVWNEDMFQKLLIRDDDEEQEWGHVIWTDDPKKARDYKGFEHRLTLVDGVWTYHGPHGNHLESEEYPDFAPVLNLSEGCPF